MQYTQILVLVVVVVSTACFSAPTEESITTDRSTLSSDSEATAAENIDSLQFLESVENVSDSHNNSTSAENSQLPEALPLRINYNTYPREQEDNYPEEVITKHRQKLQPVKTTYKPHGFFRPKKLHYLVKSFSSSTDLPMRLLVTPAVTQAPQSSTKQDILSYPAALEGASAQGLVSSPPTLSALVNEIPRVAATPAVQVHDAGFQSNVRHAPSPPQMLHAYVHPQQLFGHVNKQGEKPRRKGPPIPQQVQESHDNAQIVPGNAKYHFGYRVQDSGHGAVVNKQGQQIPGTGISSDYGHSEARDGKRTWGRYFVKLPDGRVQTVRYWADQTGYHAQVLFTGTAHHPQVLGPQGQYGRSGTSFNMDDHHNNEPNVDTERSGRQSYSSR